MILTYQQIKKENLKTLQFMIKCKGRFHTPFSLLVLYTSILVLYHESGSDPGFQIRLAKI